MFPALSELLVSIARPDEDFLILFPPCGMTSLGARYTCFSGIPTSRGNGRHLINLRLYDVRKCYQYVLCLGVV